MTTVINIKLPSGDTLIVDEAGADLYRRFTWRVNKQKTRLGRVYRYLERCLDRCAFHRILLDAPRGFVVDHRDGDGLNNTTANLRLCTHAENMRNRRSTSGRVLPKGVLIRGRTYTAEIKAGKVRRRKGGKVRRRKGGFPTAIAAAECYAEWARELHGEFAFTESKPSKQKAEV